jgi:acyl-CoA thioesterase
MTLDQNPNPDTPMTPKQRAQKAAAAMWDSDAASKWLGMRIVDVDEGTATLDLTVADHHCNGHGICHGGITFALADSAFAFACNSRNQSTVAQHNMISYTAPARSGDTLTAQARELSLTGRSGIYDVTVTDQTGRTIAQFRGMSRAINGTLFDE